MDDLKLSKKADDYADEHRINYGDKDFEHLEKLYRLLGYVQGAVMIYNTETLNIIEKSLQEIIDLIENN